MTFSMEFKPHEVDTIVTALIALGAHFNEKAKAADAIGSKLYRAKADEVFKMVCNMPRLDNEECCSEIASHQVEVSKAAWGDWFAVGGAA